MKNTFVVIDDAPFIRELVVTALKKEGYLFLGEAGDGSSACELIRQARPDVIFLDLVLPVKNGLQVAEEIQQIWPQGKIIGMTAIDFELNEVTNQELMLFDRVLRKPFTKEQLVAAFDRLNTQEREIA